MNQSLPDPKTDPKDIPSWTQPIPADIDDLPDAERTDADPIHLGPTGTRTQLSDDTITEVAIGRDSLPD